MTYAPGTWVENTTIIHATDLQRIEAGIAANDAAVTAAAATATSAQRGARPAYVPANAQNFYDPIHNVYNFKPSNTRRLRAGLALAMRGGQTTNIVFGDSSGAGCINSVTVPNLFDRPHAWPIGIRDELARHGIPSGGYGLYRFVDGPNVPSYVTSTGTWIGSQGWTSSSVNGSTITLTVTEAGTAVDVWYFDTGTATWTVSLDGAASGAGFKSVTQTNTNQMRKVTLIGVTVNIGSTVRITKTSASSTIFVVTSVYTPNGGFIMHNASQSGAKAAGTGSASWGDFTSGTGLGWVYQYLAGVQRVVTDAVTTNGSTTIASNQAFFSQSDVGSQLRQIPGATTPPIPLNTYITAVAGDGLSATMSQAATQNTTAQTVGIGDDPSCIHICLGGNDHPVSVTPIATIIAAVQAIRLAHPNSDCILYFENQESPSLITDVDWEAYGSALYTLADALDVPLVDLRDRVGNYTTGLTNGSYGDSIAHLTAATYSGFGRSVGLLLAS